MDLSNLGGNSLASVVTSILTYGIVIWDEALKMKECRRKAVCVIAGMMPIEVVVVERKQLYEQRSSTPEEHEENKNMRQDSLQRWQEKWDASGKGRWMLHFSCWVNRKHGKVNYYLTQMPSNHG